MDDITLEFETGALPTLKRRWAHSNAVDEPVGFEEYAASGPAGSGTERLMYADRQGSILWVTNPLSDDVVAAYEYNGFGQITQTLGALIQPYGYTGREYDPETKLYYYRARHYDARIGGFVQSDPIGFAAGPLAIFSYAANNPYTFGDPSGLETANFANHSNAAAATALGIGAGALTAALLLTNDINAILRRDITKIHVAPGTTMGDRPRGTPRIPPPGDCTKKQLKRLEKAKSKANKPGLSCNAKDSFGTLSWKIGKLEVLLAARTAINTVCFRGGDPGHQKAAQIIRTRITNCQTIIGTRWGRKGLHGK